MRFELALEVEIRGRRHGPTAYVESGHDESDERGRGNSSPYDRRIYAFTFARPDDLPAVHALIESAYRGETSRAGWTTEADLVRGPRTSVDELAELVASPDNEFLLARDPAGALVACCHLQKRADSAYFGMFAVDPTRQGGGVGDAMLAEAERIVRDEWHRPQLTMWVIGVRGELIAWYERRGYKRTGEAVDFSYDADAPAGPIEPGLEFLVLAKEL